jgi:hypothetical protein
MQPLVVVLGQEFPVDALQLGAGGLPESRCRDAQEPALDGDQGAVVDVVLRQGREFGGLVRGQEAPVDQVADVDQHLVAGKGR